MFDFLHGKKTYLVAAIAGGLAVAEALGYPVPPYVYAVLGALGLTTTRAAIGKVG